jgi:hypothetical protein
MNALFAGIVAGFCGLLQLIAIMAIEMQDENEKSGFLASDIAFPIFALLVLTEIMCVLALSMYRISPWLFRKIGDDWEANRIASARERYGTALQSTTIAATVLRRVVVMIDAGSFSSHLALSLGVALAVFLIPKPKV